MEPIYQNLKIVLKGFEQMIKFALPLPLWANVLICYICLEPTVPAGHVQVTVPPQVQEPDPPRDIHHSGRPGDHGLPPTLPQVQERGNNLIYFVIDSLNDRFSKLSCLFLHFLKS